MWPVIRFEPEFISVHSTNHHITANKCWLMGVGTKLLQKVETLYLTCPTCLQWFMYGFVFVYGGHMTEFKLKMQNDYHVFYCL